MRHPTRTLRRRSALASATVIVLAFGIAPAGIAAEPDTVADTDETDDPTDEPAPVSTEDPTLDPTDEPTAVVTEDPTDEVTEVVEDTTQDPAGTVESASQDIAEATSTLVDGPDDEPTDAPTEEPTREEPSNPDDGPGDTDDSSEDAHDDRASAPADTPNKPVAALAVGPISSSAPDRADDGAEQPTDAAPAAVVAPGSRGPGPSSPDQFRGPLPGLDLQLPAASTRTDAVLELLRRAGADPATVARIMAPFPLAGPASYDATDTTYVDLTTPVGTPVIAAGGAVTVLEGALGVAVELTAADGSRYRYDGLQPALDVTDGDTVVAGDQLGRVARSGAEGTLRFSLWDPAGNPLRAAVYLDRWLAEAHQAASLLADASGGAFTPQVAPPTDGGPGVADTAPWAPALTLPDQTTQSSFAPTGAPGDGPPTGFLVLGMFATVILGSRALRPHRHPRISPTGFIDDLSIHQPDR